MAAVPRAAATVVLLRDGRGGLEAYLQRRPMGMGFAGGLWVFPGGRVDDADRDPAVEAAWAGPPAADWAERLGLGVEEAGLLLATPPPGVAEVAAARRELLAGSAGLAELLARLGV
ncbi:MAG TPA: NUDIX domain-containing protein, partial [Actinomycetes bacterium]|nr:NUDIX domain-containing protein [Actinomycetes bacterium]